MTKTELKSSIVKIVASINDSSILENLHNQLLQHKAEKEGEADWWLTASEQEKALVEKGMNDIKNGRTTPHEDVMNEIKNRFN